MTLKTGVHSKNSALHHRNKLQFTICSKRMLSFLIIKFLIISLLLWYFYWAEETFRKHFKRFKMLHLNSSVNGLFQIRSKITFKNIFSKVKALSSNRSGSIYSRVRPPGVWGFVSTNRALKSVSEKHQVKSDGSIRNGLILNQTLWHCLHLGWVNPWALKVEWLV